MATADTATGDTVAAPAPWTTDVASDSATLAGGNAVVTDLRTGRHADYERLVFELSDADAGSPGYNVWYVDTPLRECGSGREIHPEGQAWLEVRLSPAAAHTEEGTATVGHDPRSLPGLDNLRRVYTTCDFEGVVTFVVAMASPHPFRAFSLESPPRLVVDVRR